MPEELESLRSALSATYNVERELGRGGMATVYLATDRKHERSVAIKVLRSELAASVGHDRFLREVKLTAKLTHPHILPLIDSGEVSGMLYYVMPFVAGESLRDRLNRESQLPLSDAIEIGCHVASALSYAHRAGVIHRDIKPENILLSDGEAIVADFGIARAVTTAGGEHLTSTGLAVGTPAYMSPEQSTGSDDVDARSDIYSLGTVVYEMIAGETPFTGPNPQSVIAKRLTSEVPRLGIVRDVSDSMELAVRKALARAPADRWATMDQFTEALRAERTTQSNVAFTPNAKTQSSRERTLTTRRISMAAATVALVLIATYAWSWLNAERVAPIVRPPVGMVLVPGGQYSLGGGTCDQCVPARRATIDSFYIDSTEVTIAAFRSLAPGAGVAIPPNLSEDGRMPVTSVMWDDAQKYCEQRDSLGKLPSADEWEAAARGTDGGTYPWGNDWKSTSANANYKNGRIGRVGMYPDGKSVFGAVDMVGNVWEWTSTPAPPDSTGTPMYVFRGGAYDSPPTVASALARVPFPASAPTRRTYEKTGFRCARSLR